MNKNRRPLLGNSNAIRTIPRRRRRWRWGRLLIALLAIWLGWAVDGIAADVRREAAFAEGWR